jgi:methylmalonyl-CoA/ethylmalonyl-CoA epimerase
MHPRDVHHIGHAVVSLDAAIDTYARVLGATVDHRETVPDQGVEAAFLRLGRGRLELLAALGPDTPVGRFLAKRGQGMHHVAYLVDDVQAALDQARAAGAELIDERPRPGLGGLEVAFVHPESVHGVLVEFVQERDDGAAHEQQ